MPSVETLPHPRVLVLSGGGGNGAAQAAAVLELYRQGLKPDLIIGTSIGAWNGAYLATHPGLAGAKSLVRLWCDGAFFQMARPRPWRVLRAALLHAPTVVGRASIRRALERTDLATKTWGDTSIPFIVGAIDARTLTLRYWDGTHPAERLAPYVASSSALTPLLPFGIIDGREYVDAGMQDNYGIPEVVKRLDSQGIRGASLIVIDCAPSLIHPAQSVVQSADVALGATFRRHREDGIAMAVAAGHHVELIEVGGNHEISDYMDPADGIAVGIDAVRAWAAGVPHYPQWPSTSLLRRVANVVCFTVEDALIHRGLTASGAIRRLSAPGVGV